MDINEQMANNYFEECLKKVYVNHGNGNIETFKKYLSHRNCDFQYYYSAYAIMSLDIDDFLVRGYTNNNYEHGWVEFSYCGNDYIFDPLLHGIMPKQNWYTKFNPSYIYYKKSKKNILNKYLSNEYAIKIANKIWQFQYLLSTTDDLMDLERKEGYILSALSLSHVEIDRYSLDRISMFMAYNTN